ncbi:bifunctional folylpolyglutamate synthase/dihydrofolate synthase [Croceicoccus naphthovorans]|uniref:tetrahydrofolate synthase n=1 Tax=Croceicoccus naphthovorans TaxID=1348774 RepID=A0A0G3XEP5_9SPHN|nr:folylpolyglutamate synthase/dihydrofolate synthase family protein [Croceicoccus naphthovorans]AKM09667.1 folylpolyglutamate synthase [Croceicoccus naphthovorans]MBB3990789.1 dihydrofolate synthase/folylpolyglutamate synthase [Croceicoccus naphthovorans]
MRDFAVSDSPAVQAQLDRLAALSLPQGRLGLDPVRELLARVGNPHERLPPVFHIAGTNGKGSTSAFLRAMLEADGKRVHQFNSPHLVRYNERIRLAGELISDDALADVLAEVLDAGSDIGASFFEITTAAAFLAFARTPADACVVEVGLGGRFDATNVIARPAVCGIASLGLDHERFLLAPEDGVPEHPMARIAFEKAGIVKPGVPVVTQAYGTEAEAELERAAMVAGAPLHMRGKDWDATAGATIEYRDGHGALTLPLPTLPGAFQADNAALAVAMLRHQDQMTVSAEALAVGVLDAQWPARLQWLGDGPLTKIVRPSRVLLDGGHNPDAGRVLGDFFRKLNAPIHAVSAMLDAKDAGGFLAPFADRLASFTAVPLPSHDSYPPADLARIASEAGVPKTSTAASVADALRALKGEGPVLICGSLYLAGEVLRANEEWPD